MPLKLDGSCHCGAVHFTCVSHTPQPYQRCYCTVCRKTAGGGGTAINIMAVAASMKIDDPGGTIAVYRAKFVGDDGTAFTSPAERSFCSRCASTLWLWDPRWPDLIHPFASVIDTDLPVPVEQTHIMLDFKPAWLVPQTAPNDACFDEYPAEAIEDWHKSRGLWID